MFWRGSRHRRRPSKGRRASAHTPAQVGCSSAIFKIEKPFPNRHHRHHRQRSGHSLWHSGAGCATNGVSPTRRSIPISRPWSILLGLRKQSGHNLAITEKLASAASLFQRNPKLKHFELVNFGESESEIRYSKLEQLSAEILAPGATVPL